MAVGRGDDAHVDLARPGVADRHDLALLEHAQELRLHRARHFAHLVEEDRALLGGFEDAAPVLDRAREGAATVPEELALEQRLLERGAVDGEERPVGARALAMDRARDELLARAGLALDEDRDR